MKRRNGVIVAAIYALLAVLLIITGCANRAPGADTGASPSTGGADNPATGTQSAVTAEPEGERDPEREVTGITIKEAENGMSWACGHLIEEGEKYAFYGDEKAVYTYRDPDKYTLEVSFGYDGTLAFEDAYREGIVSIPDLDKYGVEYVRYEKGTPEYAEYFGIYAQRKTMDTLDSAVCAYVYGVRDDKGFEPGGTVDGDAFIAFYRNSFMDDDVDALLKTKYGQYYSGDGGVFDIPIDLYESELKQYFDVTFSDKAYRNQSANVPGAISIIPRFAGEGVGYGFDVEGEEDGVLNLECHSSSQSYQGIFYKDGENVFVSVAANTFTLGVKVSPDFRTYRYEYCRDVAHHAYTEEDFASIVPGVSTLDDVLKIAPEAIYADVGENMTGKGYLAVSRAGENFDEGSILFTFTPDRIVESVSTEK